jgi:RNA 3'-terminal phosphate cyclase
MQCQFKDCSNHATKVVWRPIIGVEQEQRGSYPEGGGSTLPVQERIVVCDLHVEQAKKVNSESARGHGAG